MKTTAYHGTVWGGFSEFSQDLQPDFGMYFTDDGVVAEGYAGTDETYDGAREDFYPCVYYVKLTIANPLIINAQGKGWEDIDGLTTREIAAQAKRDGYDGVVFENVIDCGPYCSDLREATTYVVFESSQISIL